ncbi:MAG: hypothetical protein K5683_00145 [Prevotella sp.]|nr:hypothetical protein [Prevotella sp.]
MKIRKFFCGLALTTLAASAPATLTSCDDDDVNTIINILDLLFTSTDDLAGSAWLSTDNSLALEFSNGNQGSLYDSTKMDDQGAVAQPFTYTLDTQNNVLTITLSQGGTRRYTVTEFTKGTKLTLTYNGTTIYMKPYTG